MRKIIALLLFASIAGCQSAKDSFAFEKMTFHSGPCFGTCPSYHMEIRSDKTVLLKGDSLYSKRGTFDYGRVGRYTARLSDTTYARLLGELRAMGLDTVRFQGPYCCDAPMKTMIVYYNGKRKYLRAMFPPGHARQLLATLHGIYARSAFTPSEQQFEIELDSVPQRR